MKWMHLFILKFVLFFLCLSACLPAYLFLIYEYVSSGACGVQKRPMDPLELEL